MSDSELELDWNQLLTAPLPVVSRALNTLRRSNNVPSEAQAQAMHVFLEECEERSCAMEDAMELLRERQEALQLTMTKWRRALSPMAQVCAGWRDALIRFSSLWTTIGTPGVSTATQLARSGNALLRVQITPRTDEEVDAHLEHLLPHAARWGTLLIGSPDYAEFNNTSHTFDPVFIKEIVPPAVTFGKVSELILYSDIFPWEEYSVQAMFPALRRLSMYRIFTSPVATIFPWRQLTHFASHISNIDPVYVLKNAPNLVHFAVDGSPFESMDSELDKSTIRMAHLRSIFLSRSYTKILRLLVAPTLQVMAVLPWAGSTNNGLSIINDFLERSSPPLTTLVLEMGIWSQGIRRWGTRDKEVFVPQDLPPTLRLCPALEYLLLYTSPARDRDTGPDEYTLKLLYEALEGEQGLCPRLTHFLFGCGKQARRSSSYYNGYGSQSRTPSNSVRKAFRSMIIKRANPPAYAGYERLRHLSLGKEDKKLIELHSVDSTDDSTGTDERELDEDTLDIEIMEQEAIVDIALQWRGFPLDWLPNIRSGY
ncbi:hypothetical protein MIND_00568400 [Mycena indigotica]|uniref:Uncharacterized protein n=1 Tax=Mycena indigotica TaxID=2126181 RepID=A0A8H6SSZ9_9AGAR|nr:uncharacterized protein MIND_00568400 [Mycena indigotica]KAF7303400.1 hypothetical protein MIND_00568400 [Mycena indigotica]